MDNEFLKERISGTKTDIFPLDRLLPLETVFSIFKREYSKSEDRNLFFKDRKFQRLREGYFSLFVAISLQDISGEPHYVVFPTDPSNDFYLTYKLEGTYTVDKLGAYAFDMKEFTNWSPTFSDFLRGSIIPKIGIYNIAIPLYRRLDGLDTQPLVEYLKTNDLSTQVWFIGSPTEEDPGNNISGVSILSKDGLVYQKVLNLSDWLDLSKPEIIFQDVIRFKSN